MSPTLGKRRAPPDFPSSAASLERPKRGIAVKKEEASEKPVDAAACDAVPPTQRRGTPEDKRRRIKQEPASPPLLSETKTEVSVEAVAVKKEEDRKGKDKSSSGISKVKRRARVTVKAESRGSAGGRVVAGSSVALGANIFGGFAGPSPEACQVVHDALASVHGLPDRYASGSVLDGLVRTILSQNTTDKTSAMAFRGLKKGFPTWKAVLDAPAGAVEESIRCGGLADIKAERIRVILRWLLEHRVANCLGGEPSLEYLREMDDEGIKQELGQFKGVGPKTIACLLMFTLGRQEFPVDTHVLRIARDRLRWVPKNATRETTYLFLNAVIPDHLKFGLHVLLVGHGKVCARCCAAARRGTVPCPLPS